jgi:hypothetical protein
MLRKMSPHRYEFLVALLARAGGISNAWYEVVENNVPGNPFHPHLMIRDRAGNTPASTVPCKVDVDHFDQGLRMIRGARPDLLATGLRRDGSEYPIAGYVDDTGRPLGIDSETRDRIVRADEAEDSSCLTNDDILNILEVALFGARQH